MCISLFPEAFCSALCMESAHEIFTERSAAEMNLLIVKLLVEPQLGVGQKGQRLSSCRYVFLIKFELLRSWSAFQAFC